MGATIYTSSAWGQKAAWDPMHMVDEPPCPAPRFMTKSSSNSCLFPILRQIKVAFTIYLLRRVYIQLETLPGPAATWLPAPPQPGSGTLMELPESNSSSQNLGSRFSFVKLRQFLIICLKESRSAGVGLLWILKSLGQPFKNILRFKQNNSKQSLPSWLGKAMRSHLLINRGKKGNSEQ